MADDSRIRMYGLNWLPTVSPVWREMDMVRYGGRWKTSSGVMVGNGLVYHFKKLIHLLWPEIVFHKWNERIIAAYCKHRVIGIIGPASSGKTNTAALCVLADYYVWSDQTTVICCSTTKERLEDRIWGEIKQLHRRAKSRYPLLPGYLIEGRLRIVTDKRSEAAEGRDFRNGMIGVPCKKGESYVGLGDFAGIKNKRVRLLGDELSLLPRVFVDAISNLDKNPNLKVLGLGNPKETTDALGVLCEPAAHLGGWDGGIDQTPGTKEWEIKRPGGICIQLPGTDSPNLDGKLGIPLITQEQIDRDVAFYTKDSLWFTMMDEGRMPRGQGAHRVITRQMCEKFGAMAAPIWSTSASRVKIAFLDAAYRGAGGDRCVFGELQFGNEVTVADEAARLLLSAILDQRPDSRHQKQILALIDTVIVPVNVTLAELPEDQIVQFVMKQCAARGIPPENFFFDAGMRSSLVSAFARLWSSNVNPIDCGGDPSARPVSAEISMPCKDHYSKFITELWYSVRYIIEAGQFRGMTEDVMWEGCTREYGIVGKNKIEVEPKWKMKEKMGRSPDLFDALAIGVEGARQRGFVIQRLANIRRKTKGERDWRDEARDKAQALRKSKSLTYTR